MFFNDSSADMLNAIRGRANWWAAPLADIAPWLESLPPYTREAHRALFQAMGSAWDGVSDITLSGKVDDEECLTAATVSDLLTRLEEELPSQLGIAHQALGPDNVRCLTNWENSDWSFCIDINVNGVIVPFAINDRCLKKGGSDVCSYVIGHILKILRHMVRYDEYWHAKDLRMRQAMEKAVTLMGPGSTPLWLRRQAIAFDTPARYFRVVPYVMAFAMLDDCLHWSVKGDDRCWDPTSVKQTGQACSAAQARRAEARDALEQNGGYAFVTDFAADLIKDMGLNYKAVVDSVYEASLQSTYEKSEYRHKGATIRFFFNDGVVDAMITSEQFCCLQGKMLFSPDTPAKTVIGRSGTPMRYLFDFPVFENVGCTIGQISITDKLELDYAVERLMLAA